MDPRSPGASHALLRGLQTLGPHLQGSVPLPTPRRCRALSGSWEPGSGCGRDERTLLGGQRAGLGWCL